MHRIGLVLGVCAILTLSACTANPAPAPSSQAPSPSISSPTPVASSAIPTSATPTPTAATPTAKPSPTPSVSTFDPTLSLLGTFTYRSGERPKSVKFFVPVSGYTVSYVCKALSDVPNDSHYVITSPTGQELARRTLICDGATHSKKVPASEVARAGTAQKMLTITLPGDLQGITVATVTVRGDAA